MKILYLYAEVMGYTMAVVEALVTKGAEVHIVHWDHKKLTPYQPQVCPNVYMYKRSQMNLSSLKQLAEKIEPIITVLSGWMDNTYMALAYSLRARGGIVVAGFDGHWHGTFRQKVAEVLGKLGYFSHYYSHAWVAGNFQFEYARRLGFDKKMIIYDLYSADLTLFQTACKSNLRKKQISYPHRFLFVGRLESVKGVDTLLDAWQLLKSVKGNWQLHVVGNGSFKPALLNTPGLVVKDFMQPEQLCKEVAESGCFILPSRNEPWGVVVHEFAGAGLPLILSDVVGSSSTFLIAGWNGFHFKANDSLSLANSMKRIIDTSDHDLLAMATASHQLSTRITPQTAANNLLAITY